MLHLLLNGPSAELHMLLSVPLMLNCPLAEMHMLLNGPLAELHNYVAECSLTYNSCICC